MERDSRPWAITLKENWKNWVIWQWEQTRDLHIWLIKLWSCDDCWSLGRNGIGHYSNFTHNKIFVCCDYIPPVLGVASNEMVYLSICWVTIFCKKSFYLHVIKIFVYYNYFHPMSMSHFWWSRLLDDHN